MILSKMDTKRAGQLECVEYGSFETARPDVKRYGPQEDSIRSGNSPLDSKSVVDTTQSEMMPCIHSPDTRQR